MSDYSWFQFTVYLFTVTSWIFLMIGIVVIVISFLRYAFRSTNTGLRILGAAFSIFLVVLFIVGYSWLTGFGKLFYAGSLG